MCHKDNIGTNESSLKRKLFKVERKKKNATNRKSEQRNIKT